jgi:hypothetical protein
MMSLYILYNRALDYALQLSVVVAAWEKGKGGCEAQQLRIIARKMRAVLRLGGRSAGGLKALRL